MAFWLVEPLYFSFLSIKIRVFTVVMVSLIIEMIFNRIEVHVFESNYHMIYGKNKIAPKQVNMNNVITIQEMMNIFEEGQSIGTNRMADLSMTIEQKMEITNEK